jgi:hypothetical protein
VGFDSPQRLIQPLPGQPIKVMGMEPIPWLGQDGARRGEETGKDGQIPAAGPAAAPRARFGKHLLAAVGAEGALIEATGQGL